MVTENKRKLPAVSKYYAIYEEHFTNTTHCALSAAEQRRTHVRHQLVVPEIQTLSIHTYIHT